MAANTTIALVSGAYHVGSSMSLLSTELFHKGFATRSTGLVTVNRPEFSVKDDVSSLINDLLNPLIAEQGQNVILYLHSYSGFPASAAIAGFSKSERAAKGLEGGIVGLIYQSAFVPRAGDTVRGMLGGKKPEWQEFDREAGVAKVINPKETFYNGVPEPLATVASQEVLPQSLGTFTEPSGPVFYGDDAYRDRRVYIHTTEDQTLPPAAQDLFVERSGVEWDVRRIVTGHSPFLSEPRELAQLVSDITKGFLTTSDCL